MDAHLSPAIGQVNQGYTVSKLAAWLVFGLTFLLMVFDFIDRQIVVSMLPSIKQDWVLSDTQLGGLVSAVSLAVGAFTVPIAIFADRWSRAKCILAMAVIWSVATIACGYATRYEELVALRGVVGVGEAGYGAVGGALLAGIFPSRMRATILAAFSAAGAIGAVLGVVLGGVISKTYGWHSAFGIVGIPGLILSLFYIFVQDEKPDPLTQSASGTVRRTGSLRGMLRLMLRTPSALTIFVGSVFQYFVISTVYSWLPSFLNREYGLPVDQAGIRAAFVLIAASIGAIIWGVVADRVGRRQPRNKIFVLAFSSFVSSIVLMTAFGLFPPGQTQFALVMLGAVLMTGILGTTSAIALDVANPGIRATTIAVGAFMQNIFGLGAGPFVGGIVSDHYGLATALAVIPAFGVIAGLAFLLTVGTFDRDLKRTGDASAAMAPPAATATMSRIGIP